MANLKIMTLNARGLANQSKRRDLFQYIKAKGASICCIQEFHCTESLEHIYKAEWGHGCLFSGNSTNSWGVAILFNKDFEYKIHTSEKDKDGDLIAVDIEIENCRFTLVNIYGPNKDTPSFFSKLKQTILNFENASVMICGDWNLVLDQE